MKKYLTIFISLILTAMLLIVAGCEDGSNYQGELNQWDYFDEYVIYSLYDYIEDNKDWNKTLITNSDGEVQQNCYTTVASLDNNVSIKDLKSHSDYNYYRQIAVSHKVSDKKIIMTELSVQIYADADCEMVFSLKIAGDARVLTTVNAVANTATELLFENFAEYTWAENSKAAMTIALENPAEIGNVKYGFSDLKLTLRNDD